MNLSDNPSARMTDAEIARRALKLLAERKIIPTPQTFTEVCHEITGVKNSGVSPAAVIRDVVRDLVKTGRLSSQEGVAVVEAAQSQHWLIVRENLDRALARKAGGATARWPQMTLTLLRQADALHTNWTRARKLDAVARVIDGAADQPDVALERLARLIESWGGGLPTLSTSGAGARDVGDTVAGPATLPAQSLSSSLSPASPAARAAADVRPVADPRTVTQRYGSDPALQAARDHALAQAEAWKQVALRASNLLAAACGEGTPAAKKIGEYVKDAVRQGIVAAPASGSGTDITSAVPADPVLGTDRIAARFIDLVVHIERQLAEEHKVRQGLQRLLAMLCDNIKTLSPDEVWLAGQLEPIRALLLHPMGYSALEQAEARLAQVIAHQGRARQGLNEAKVALKEMLSTLIDNIGTASDSTSTFCAQVEGYQKQLERASDFGTLSRVLSGLMTDTAQMRQGIEQSRDELSEARRKVESYESRVQELERELSQVSSLVQKDPLTFALNRRGLEETFRIEAARAARYSVPLSLMVIDLDDFKKVNDTLGHAAGDRALVHLATTCQLALRPTDCIARFGGEEFMLLFPVTDLKTAREVGERLRQELARRPFQWEGAPHPFTFSGGLCEWRPNESLESCTQRADAAMYEAKRTGKDRIVSSE